MRPSGPDGSRCYISSIVELPMFYEPGSIFYGSMFGTTTEVYEPIIFEVEQGRNIQIPSGFTKYKIELNCNGDMAWVVGVALHPFNPNNILSEEVGAIPFFPIYIHAGRRCYLFIESINDLFDKTGMVCSNIGTNRVMSPMQLIRSIDDCVGPVGDDMCYDVRYAHIGMQHRLLEFIMSCLSKTASASWNGQDENRDLRSMYGILDDAIPLSIQFLGNVRYVAQLRPFLNPYGNVPSDIAMAAITTVRNNYNQIKEMLRANDALPDRVGDIYMTEPEDMSFTGRWLSMIFEHEMSDFQFPIRKNERDISDVYARECHVYDGFRHSFSRLTNWNDLSSCLMSSLLFGNAIQDGDATVQRSWLEDIVIRDSSGKVVRYADIVLLVLACAESLINEKISTQIETLFH